MAAARSISTATSPTRRCICRRSPQRRHPHLLWTAAACARTHDLLEFIDVAIVTERLCEQMDLTPQEMLGCLKSRGCKMWRRHSGGAQSRLVRRRRDGGRDAGPRHPERSDHRLNGAGDIFHGAYIYSAVARPGLLLAARALRLRPRSLGAPSSISATSRATVARGYRPNCRRPMGAQGRKPSRPPDPFVPLVRAATRSDGTAAGAAGYGTCGRCYAAVSCLRGLRPRNGSPSTAPLRI